MQEEREVEVEEEAAAAAAATTKHLAPFLEESDSLASTVGAPEIAAATRAEAAVVGPMIAVPVATYARAPVHRDPRGPSIRD